MPEGVMTIYTALINADYSPGAYSLWGCHMKMTKQRRLSAEFLAQQNTDISPLPNEGRDEIFTGNIAYRLDRLMSQR
jgi:hypothetical protein